MSRPAEEGAPSTRSIQTEVSGYQTVMVNEGFSSWGERQSREPIGPFQVWVLVEGAVKSEQKERDAGLCELAALHGLCLRESSWPLLLNVSRMLWFLFFLGHRLFLPS